MCFAVTAAVVAVTLLVAANGGTRQGGGPWAAASDALLLVACTLVLLHAARIELVGAPLAEEDLVGEGDSVSMPAIGRPVSVLVGGTLAGERGNAPRAAHYTLAVADDQHTLLRHEGTFSESWSRVGRGRRGRLAVHTVVEEERIDLPGETTGRGLTLTLSSLDGELDGPVKVGLVPAPWSPICVALAGFALLLAGAGVDARRASGSKRAVCLAVLALFSLCLTRRITPGGPWSTVLGAAFVATLGGLPLGLLVSAIARRLIRRGRIVPVA